MQYNISLILSINSTIRDAACEIIDIQDPSLQTKAVMCDRDDEVNIAQFHPLPGHGVVYGTKRGKIRTFARAIA